MTLLIHKDEFPGEVTEADAQLAQQELSRVCGLPLENSEMERGLPFSIGCTIVQATWPRIIKMVPWIDGLDTRFEDDHSRVPYMAIERLVGDDLVRIHPSRTQGLVRVFVNQKTAPGKTVLSAILPFREVDSLRPANWYIYDPVLLLLAGP
jgi:hypothetical protein